MHQGQKNNPSWIERRGLPVSPLQAGMVFDVMMSPRSGVDTLQFVIALEGRLELAVLRRAWETVVNAHEILRSGFETGASGDVTRCVASSVSIPCESVSLPSCSDDDLEAFLRRDRARGFELSVPPLMRLVAINSDGADARIIWTVFHALFDGRNVERILTEILTTYNALLDDTCVTLTPSPLFDDYARWTQGLSHEESEMFWREELRGFDEPTPLGIGAGGHRGGGAHRRRSLSFTAAESKAFDDVAADCGVTPNTLVQSAWALLLARYSGRTDVVLGTAKTCRRSSVPDADETIGPFINTLPLRLSVDDDTRCEDFLKDARERWVRLRTHEHVPLPLIQEWSDVDASSSLFESLTGYDTERYEDTFLQIPGMHARGRSLDIYVQTAVPLCLMAHRGDELVLWLSYDPERFGAADIEQMLAHMRRLMLGIIEDPKRRLGDVALMTDSERAELVPGPTPPVAARFTSVPGRVLDMCLRHPDKVVLSAEDGGFTSSTLLERARRIAHALLCRGVGPGDSVCVMLDRSPDVAAVAFGSWLCGASYIPIDPANPDNRLARMLEDGRGKLVVTSAEYALRETLAERAVMVLDELSPSGDPISIGETQRVVGSVAPDDIAYVIFTSGSAGRPKAVELTHRGLESLVHWHIERYGLSDADITTQIAGVGFDACVWELWPSLSVGARVEFAPQRVLTDSDSAWSWLRSTGASVSFVPTALAELMLDTPPAEFGPLRSLLTGGDRLRRPLSWRPPFEVVNHYGPTESTVVATAGVVRIDDGTGRSPDIGRPVHDTRALVLDSAMRPVPLGIPGELYLGGPALARGYRADPDLTAERFIADPYVEGERLYRTGDVVRRHRDGTFEFIGRADAQVQIRGFRVEPGEIESAMMSIDGVKAAAVIARVDAAGDHSLHAYMTAEQRAEADAELVADWSALYDDTYGSHVDSDELMFNIVGWHSSYTGEPLPEDEMREWVENAVERVTRWRPRRVLEIGAGTGLLAARIAPGCERYVALDASPRAVEHLEALSRKEPELKHLEARCALADNLPHFEPGSFDTVVLNSVVQYFPHADYLRDVLRSAAACVGDGGRIVVGDVRSLPLLEAMCASLASHALGGSSRVDELRSRTQFELDHEDELVLDPRFFLALAEDDDLFDRAEIRLKTGGSENELTRYRYECVLHVGSAPPTVDIAKEARWGKDACDLEGVRELIRYSDGALSLDQIANRRLAKDRALLRCLDLGEERGTGPCVHPDDIITLAREHDRACELMLAPGSDGDAFTFRAVFGARGSYGERLDARDVWDGHRPESWAHRPRDRKSSAWLIKRVSASLLDMLPAYMQPSSFIELQEMPLTPSGKIDRSALAQRNDVSSQAASRTPETEMERLVAEAWRDVLGVATVGVHDSFFAVGGHSLNATRLVGTLRQQLGANIPLRLPFDAPTVREQAVALEAMGPDTAVEQSTAKASGASLLSHSQRRIWFLDRLEPGGAFYNVPLALSLKGRVDPDALRRAVEFVVMRHDALRTRFIEQDGDPVARVDESPRFGWESLHTADESANLESELRVRVLEPFDLAGGPPLRVSLWKTSELSYTLLLVAHHIVCDGAAMSVVLEEISDVYRALASGTTPALMPVASQSGDFAQWERDRTESAEYREDLAYWREQLTPLPPPLDLPTDRLRTSSTGFRGGTVTAVLDDGLLGSIERVAISMNTTPYVVMLTVFKAMLGASSGTSDVTVGSPVSGRGEDRFERTVGLLVSAEVLRTDLSGDLTFAEAVQRVRATTVDAMSHRSVPFERLVEELQPERDMGRNPLFQVFFNLVDTVGLTPQLPGIEAEPVSVDIESSKFDLTLYAYIGDGSSRLDLSYSTDCLSEFSAGALLDRFTTLLRAAVQSPHAHLSTLPMRGDAERDRGSVPAPQVPEWATEALAVDPFGGWDVAVSERWRRVVAARGDDICVQDADRAWSFVEIDRIARRVAAAVGPGNSDEFGNGCIATLLGHDGPMVGTLLGLLGAGRAYVAMDSAYPDSRLSMMSKDAGVRTIVVQDSHEALAQRVGGDGVQVLRLGPLVEEALRVVPPRWDAIETGASPGAVAYALYTSGSTGRPKGVIQRQSGLMGNIKAYAHSLRLRQTDRLTLLPSYTFDAAVMDIFASTLSGARLCAWDVRGRGIDGIGDWVKDTGVTVLHSTPTVLRAVGEYVDAVIGCDVRVVVLGGEPARSSDLDTARRLFGSECVLINGLGPSESTLALQRVFALNESISRPALPIGWAVEHADVELLDERGRATELFGEIAIRSRCVALGYHNLQEQTRRVFLPDPADPESRILRTGDLGRRLPDGSLEYIGRRDSQVKIRGHRIDLAEIETILAACDGVKRAALDVRASAHGDDMLVGYIVAPGVAPEDVRRALRSTLPEYMVPQALVYIDALPMTPNGKLDTDALPPPEQERPSEDELPPSTEAESALAELWCDLLKIDSVGIQHDFFNAGGHSLLATRLASAVRQRFDIEFPLRTLFERRTIQEQALEIERIMIQQIEQLSDEEAADMTRAMGDGGAG